MSFFNPFALIKFKNSYNYINFPIQVKSTTSDEVYGITLEENYLYITDNFCVTHNSVMAMNVCAYLADKLGTKFDNDNIFFDSQTMMDAAQELPKYSVLQYDEAREGLAAIKTMKTVQQDLIDFFNECGQLNHIFVLVMPDFFTMKEEIAVGRSEVLINVYRKNVQLMRRLYKEKEARPVIRFDRGYFELFNRSKKKTLYDMSRATRRKSYQLVKANINGRFTNYYPLDRSIYDSKKKEALARFAERKEKEKKEDSKDLKATKFFIAKMKKEGLTGEKIAIEVEENLGLSYSARTINKFIQESRILEGSGAELPNLT